MNVSRFVYHFQKRVSLYVGLACLVAGIFSTAFATNPKVTSKKVVNPPQGDQSFSGLLAQGQALMNQGKYQEAIAILQKAVVLRPKNAIAHSELGWAAFLQKEIPLALQATQKAIMLSADKNLVAASLYNLGRIQQMQDKSQEAILSYQRSYYDRPSPVVEKQIHEILKDHTKSISKIPSPFLPVFLEGPYANEQAFWKKREKICKDDVDQENGEKVPAFSHEVIEKFNYVKVEFSDLSQEINEQDSISMVKDICKWGPDEEGVETYHIFYETPKGIYVLPEFAEVWHRVRDDDDLEIKKFELQQIVPGGDKELVVRFVFGSLDRSPGINWDEGFEDEKLLLIGKGPSGRPSAIQPLLLEKTENSGKEIDDKPGPKEKHSHVSFQAHFLSGGVLEIKKGTKKTGALDKNLLGKHLIRFL